MKHLAITNETKKKNIIDNKTNKQMQNKQSKHKNRQQKQLRNKILILLSKTINT